MRFVRPASVALSIMMFAGTLLAQAPVGTADITRLETTAAEIGRQVTALKASDPTLAADVEKSLADLNDEVTYLRVKLRRDGAVTREEYAATRDRLETLRLRAQGQPGAATPAATDSAKTGVPSAGGTVPAGTEFDVRLQTSLNSATAKVEQRFEAATILDYSAAGKVIVPSGSTVRGFVSSVRAANRIDRRGSLTLSFDELRIDNRSQRFRASVTQAIDSKAANTDNTRIGAGAVAGAIIGGILGGGKGALLGVLVGGGGTLAATDGADVNLPAGTILRIRIDQPVDIVAGK